MIPPSPGFDTVSRKLADGAALAPGGHARPSGPVALLAWVFELPTAALVAALEASASDQRLVAAVPDDETFRTLRGARPAVPFADRLHLAAAFRCVDRVTPWRREDLASLAALLAPGIVLLDPALRVGPAPDPPCRRLDPPVLTAEAHLVAEMRRTR